MPETKEFNNQPKQREVVEIPPELLTLLTNLSVRATLNIIAGFLHQAVNTKVKDKEGLREPTAREVVDITIGLIGEAIQRMDKADQEAQAKEQEKLSKGESAPGNENKEGVGEC